jgi:polysaccharide deacetylase 2 family uncharacterized protein YibQ
MVTFSKKPAFAAASSAPIRGSEDGAVARLLKLAANPHAGLAAGGLILLIGIGGIVLLGDPQAGAPSVRLKLGGPPASTMPASAAQPVDPTTATGEVGPDGQILPPFMEVPGSDTPASPSEVVIGSSGSAAVAAATAQALAAAPIAGLTQPGPNGLLPVIAADGRTPAQAYARPFRANGRPRIALVIGGLGINPTTTRQAIETLPPEVTLSFAPCADTACASGLQGWIDMARSRGHEVLLETPMEPLTYPQDDPGPYTLMANGKPEDTTRKLEQLMGRTTGYFGLTNYMGSKFVSTGPGWDAFVQSLRKRGLAFVDDGSAATRSSAGVPRASAERIIDEQPSPDAIARQLALIEAAATQKGEALGSGLSWAVTVRQVEAWAKGLEARGYQLAPASAMARAH